MQIILTLFNMNNIMRRFCRMPFSDRPSSTSFEIDGYMLPKKSSKKTKATLMEAAAKIFIATILAKLMTISPKLAYIYGIWNVRKYLLLILKFKGKIKTRGTVLPVPYLLMLKVPNSFAMDIKQSSLAMASLIALTGQFTYFMSVLIIYKHLQPMNSSK